MTATHSSAKGDDAKDAPKTCRGRRTRGVEHVDKLKASSEAIDRLRVVLESLTGKVTIAEAAAKLGVKESRFHVIREQALQGAVEALERQTPGPKKGKRINGPEATRIKTLEEEVDRLQLELLGANVRTPNRPGGAQTADRQAGRKKNRNRQRKAPGEATAHPTQAPLTPKPRPATPPASTASSSPCAPSSPSSCSTPPSTRPTAAKRWQA